MCLTFAAFDFRRAVTRFGLGALIMGSSVLPATAQAPAATAPASQATGSNPAPPTGVAPRPASPAAGVSAEYVIGPEDVLGISFWREAEMTGDVTVRPDGRITLPLIGELKAAGLTPDALKQEIHKAATKLFEDPTVSVIVRQVNSRKVFIMGSVTTPGSHPLIRDNLTVMQLIAMSGGLTEFADKKNITVVRIEGGKQKTFKLNYNEVAEGKRLEQNIVLIPGDTVIVK
jgi:polysaccharide biosynthesis/export protein